MTTLDPSAATILIATDSTSDAVLVKHILDAEFGKVFTTNPDKTVDDFDRQRPDVLVLAFNALEKSEHYYLKIFRLSAAAHLHPHRTVILCNSDELR